ncbi:snare associated Golgi protein-domain-containing protein [Sporodiniella umbellata]|nr:snare associated Golgi protein-domain-containing protein [Sporodiniella umbellata]
MQKKGIALIGGAVALIVIVFFAIHRATIRELIQAVAISLRTTPYSPILLTCLITLTSIPPLIGFTFSTSITGFIYGFPGGILPAIAGAFIGATTAFFLIRKYDFARFIKLSPSKQEKYMAIQEAIEQGGFKMMILIRLSPIPWPITNMLLSIISTISARQYLLAAALASTKVCLDVWIGSQLADLSNPDLPPSAHRIAVITMGCSVLIFVCVAWWLYRLTMLKVKEMTNRRIGETRGYDKTVAMDSVVIVPSKKQI